MEYQRKLYLINEESELAKSSLTKSSLQKTELDRLPFYELNFFSTHNSAINKCQIGCNSNMKEISRYLKFIQFFPICIELDLIYNDKGTFVGHLTNNNTPIKEVLESISTILEDVKKSVQENKIYPLVIVLDNSTLYKGILQMTELFNRTQTQKDNLATYMRGVLVNCKTFFNGNTVDGQVSCSDPLSELMNKVLFRFKDEKNIANITENMGVSKAINVGDISISDQIGKIMVDKKITPLENKAIIRTYPRMANVIFIMKASKRRGSLGLLDTGDNENLKQLNKDFLKHIFSPNHKINFFSFNSYSIEESEMQTLIKKFATLYGNTIPDFNLENISSPNETKVGTEVGTEVRTEVGTEVGTEVRTEVGTEVGTDEYKRTLAQYIMSIEPTIFKNIYSNPDNMPGLSKIIEAITQSVGGVEEMSTYDVKDEFNWKVVEETDDVGSNVHNHNIDTIIKEIKEVNSKYGKVNSEFVNEDPDVGAEKPEDTYVSAVNDFKTRYNIKFIHHANLGGSKKYKKKTKNKNKNKKTKNKNKNKNKKTKNKNKKNKKNKKKTTKK